MRHDPAALGVTRTAQREGWFERHKGGILVSSLVSVIALLTLHYSTTLQWLGVHDLLRRLFYLPVILAAIAAGIRGGLLTSALVSVGYLPHLVQLSRAGYAVLDHALELVLLPVIGVLVGGFASSTRRARAAAAERARLAAVGEVGMVMMTQAECPLSAIEGQVEMLSFLSSAGKSPAVLFAAQVIRREVERTRRLLADIRGLGDAASRRPGRVDLSALVKNTVGEIRAARGPGARLTLEESACRIVVRADRSVLAFSLRSLLLGLLDAVAPPGRIDLSVSDPGGVALLEIRVCSGAGPLPSLERSLIRIYGAGAEEYRFREALCIHCLAAEGASVQFSRTSATRGVVRIRFASEAADAGGEFKLGRRKVPRGRPSSREGGVLGHPPREKALATTRGVEAS